MEAPFQRLMAERQLIAHRHRGFWAPMDTLKDKQQLEMMHDSGRAPWELWTPGRNDDASLGSITRLMLPLLMGHAKQPLRLLAIGAHSDDIEIGCGGTIMKLIEQGAVSEICWVVLTGGRERASEARASAEAMLSAVPNKRVILKEFRDGYFPYDGAEIKGCLRGP